MKQPVLAGTVVLALATSHPAAHADPIVADFTYTGRLVTFTVPTSGTYNIVAFGAQGGDTNAPGGGAGGRGNEVGGDFSLSAGENLQIAVGGAGMSGGAEGRRRRGVYSATVVVAIS
jgi:hypothetical protein